MSTHILSPALGVREQSRLPPLTAAIDPVAAREWLALALLGTTATLATTFVNFRLGIPGHHIVFTVFPFALGLALVPRHGAGSVMGGAALVAALAVRLLGFRVAGVGALTSLLLTGPALDLALLWARRGPRLYAAFVLAGLLANVAALLVRALAKLAGGPGLAGGRPFAAWWPEALLTYVLAGIAAGWISAACWFHFQPKRPRARDP